MGLVGYVLVSSLALSCTNNSQQTTARWAKTMRVLKVWVMGLKITCEGLFASSVTHGGPSGIELVVHILVLSLALRCTNSSQPAAAKWMNAMSAREVWIMGSLVACEGHLDSSQKYMVVLSGSSVQMPGHVAPSLVRWSSRLLTTKDESVGCVNTTSRRTVRIGA